MTQGATGSEKEGKEFRQSTIIDKPLTCSKERGRVWTGR